MKDEIARGERPDRMSTLGEEVTISNGGTVAGRLAKRGYGISR